MMSRVNSIMADLCFWLLSVSGMMSRVNSIMADLCFWLLSVSGLMNCVNSIMADSAPRSHVFNTSAGFLNKSAICPGVESLLIQNNPNTTTLEVQVRTVRMTCHSTLHIRAWCMECVRIPEPSVK
eukprot:TRINITY_DN33862_c0_g1_i11.p2 TRINITY_DN33862_c0_g1~~TRINITY_DN33862_c0_g1_i11.p2  ORF type:complete len:125 (+),score=18.58 TRINITY_DN33862_c0_g1_i11:116-490(+)